MTHLTKPKRGDKVAVLSPSFAAAGKWPHVYDLGVKRLKEEFGLEAVEYPTTRKLDASGEERARDLVEAFENPDIKAVIATIGGDDQVTYIKNLPTTPFKNNPKPFFGFSDNTHFMSFLWQQGIPSFYGGALFTQFAMCGEIDPYTKSHLEYALFETGQKELHPSRTLNDVTLDWNDPVNLDKHLEFTPAGGWYWDGDVSAEGTTWGGCLESIDEMLRNNIALPPPEAFKNIVLMTETSEEIPSARYVRRVFRALGERGILKQVKAVLVGRAKAWEFDRKTSPEERERYRAEQYTTTLETIRAYNFAIPVVQNLDFGHTNPQIPMPYGNLARINAKEQRIWVDF